MTQTEIDTWNEFYPVGSPCLVRHDDGIEREHHTTSPAWMLGSGHAAVKLSGISGGYSLDRVRMLVTIKPSLTVAPLDQMAARVDAMRGGAR